MLFVIWFLIALATLGNKVPSLSNFNNWFYTVVAQLNTITGSTIGFAILGIIVATLMAIIYLVWLRNSTGFGCLTWLVAITAGLLIGLAALAIWEFLLSGGFMTTFSADGGIIRGEFFIWLACLYLEVRSVIFVRKIVIKRTIVIRA